MSLQSQLQALECWMEAVVRGEDWSAPLRLSAERLNARAVLAVWTEPASGLSNVSVSAAVSRDVARFCKEQAALPASGCQERDVADLGRLTWTKVPPGANVSGELTLFALSDGAVDRDHLCEIAATAASCMAMKARLSAASAISALKTVAFDQLPFGMAVVDKDLGILEVNEACFSLLARADGIRVTSNRLFCRDQRDQASLLACVSRALAGDKAAAPVKVHRAYGAPAYVIRVISARPETRLGDRVLLMIIDPDEAPSPAAEVWRAMFDLTECELIIAEGLVAGRRINEIAAQRGVSVETVRSQTKRMFERLNVSSQTQAALLLSRVTPFRAAIRSACTAQAAPRLPLAALA